MVLKNSSQIFGKIFFVVFFFLLCGLFLYYGVTFLHKTNQKDENSSLSSFGKFYEASQGDQRFQIKGELTVLKKNGAKYFATLMVENRSNLVPVNFLVGTENESINEVVLFEQEIKTDPPTTRKIQQTNRITIPEFYKRYQNFLYKEITFEVISDDQKFFVDQSLCDEGCKNRLKLIKEGIVNNKQVIAEYQKNRFPENKYLVNLVSVEQ
jgi:hypothetical protein